MSEKRSALFFDIDGTIISNKTKKIPKSTLQAFDRARADGHKIFINTGRTICSIASNIRSIPVDGYLCGCGTQIFYQDQVLMHSTIPEDKCRKYIKEMVACNIEGVFEGEEDLYFSREPYKFSRIERVRDHMKSLGLGENIYIEDIDHTKIIYDKMLVVVNEDSDTECFFDVISDEMFPIDRRRSTYECVQKKYSKATAIEYMKDYLEFGMEQVYVFGDSSNDLSMFEYADHAVAMGDHDPVLEPYTEYITDTVDEDGIYKAMKYYGLI